MTAVEITPQADDHLEDLDPEARERVLKKSPKPANGRNTASTRYRTTRTTNSGPATIAR